MSNCVSINTQVLAINDCVSSYTLGCLVRITNVLNNTWVLVMIVFQIIFGDVNPRILIKSKSFDENNLLKTCLVVIQICMSLNTNEKQYGEQ